MRILFIHANFPGQFLHLARYLGATGQHEVVFLTARLDGGELLGVRKVLFERLAPKSSDIHAYVKGIEMAVRQGQSAYQVASELKTQGFIPDIVVGHSGWGATLFMKDIFPRAAFIGYFEWFTNNHGADLGFDPEYPISLNTAFDARISNATILTDLASCDAGITPTVWQQQQFPLEYQSKLQVIHDGVRTDYFVPNAKAERIFPELNLNLSGVQEIVTYVGRGMEPYRGFPQFMEAIAKVLIQRPNCHVVVVGDDRVAYGGPPAPDGKTYKQWMLEKLDMDMSRVHFTGLLPYHRYLQILQVSSVHVYLTYPFVLSWSMLEAMSVGCLLVASDTSPVKEVITDGENGLLTDFFDVQQIANKIQEALDNQDKLQTIRQCARETIVQRYSLEKKLVQQLEFFQQVYRNVRK